MLIHYIKEKGRPCGCMLAIKSDDEIFIGFAKCGPEDYYQKIVGYEIAHGRALKFTHAIERDENGLSKKFNNKTLYLRLPLSWHNRYLDFIERAQRYFKDATLHYSVSKCRDYIKLAKNNKK